MTTPSADLERARSRLSSRSVSRRVVIGALCLLVAALGTLYVNPYSLLQLAYYMVLWNGFIYVLHREQLEDFFFAFLVNSAFIAIFYVVQTSIFPESYGTTSPLGSAWTDDSYFFSLIADDIPSGIPLRDQYFQYSQPFTTIVGFLTILPIAHPMDVIFFQSGTAALLATFSKVFTRTLSDDEDLARTVYGLTLCCPFLMMNGGVIFIRDTAVAALFVYSLACWNNRRYVPTIAATIIQVALRPGTAIILLPAQVALHFAARRALSLQAVVAMAFATAIFGVVVFATRLPEILLGPYQHYFRTMSFTGREMLAEMTAISDMNQILRWIQSLPLLPKMVLSGAYQFAYPFFSPKTAFASPYFDLRMVTLGIVYPLYAFWVNGWIFAGVLTRSRPLRNQLLVVAAAFGTLLLIGTYSIQTRHKTIIIPLLYIIAAIGWRRASPDERKIGYAASFVLLLVEIAIAFR